MSVSHYRRLAQQAVMQQALNDGVREQLKNLFVSYASGGGLEGFTVGLAALRTAHEGAMDAIEASTADEE